MRRGIGNRAAKAKRAPTSATPQPIVKGVALVRSKDGIVRLDDPKNVPANILLAMSRADREHHGLWPGDLVRDAEGIKRVTPTGKSQWTAEDALVAASWVSVDGQVFRISPRVDVAKGGTLRVRTG